MRRSQPESEAIPDLLLRKKIQGWKKIVNKERALLTRGRGRIVKIMDYKRHLADLIGFCFERPAEKDDVGEDS